MRLTRKRARELSIEKWEWLYDHPSKIDFYDLPEELQIKLWDFSAKCPLCELYVNSSSYGKCKNKCPFVQAKQICSAEGSHYSIWLVPSTSSKTRKKYAGLILQIIKDWKV